MILISSTTLLILLIVFFGPPLIVASILIPIFVINSINSKFILSHSDAIKKLDEINKKYTFNKIPTIGYEHTYDNENFYNDISPKDYLTYQLVSSQKKVSKALRDTEDNQLKYGIYLQEINNNCVLGVYDTDDLIDKKKALDRLEKKIFERNNHKPTIEFKIKVKLIRMDMGGNKKDSKSSVFTAKEIKYIITKLNQKRGDFYLDNEIWQSICRVERGKVTNKMRFAIYRRDGNRCCICGRHTKDLEIDHIYPIAKGGKSTMDNLQTLCHKCNVKKGANVY